MNRAHRVLRVRFSDERGAVTVLIGLLLPVLLGMAALVVDLGMMWQTRRHLQNCADAAALAASAELPDTLLAYSTALDYALAMGPTGCLTASDPLPDVEFVDRNGDAFMDAIEVRTQREISFGFARILGSTFGTPQARAVAGKMSPAGFRRMEPFALQVDPDQTCGEDDITSYTMNDAPLEYARSYVIKYAAGGPDSGSPGNFQALALGGTGSDVYRDNVEDGHTGWVSSCDTVTTEPGNMVGPTIDGFDLRLDDDYLHLDPWAEVILADPPAGHVRWSDCPRVINIAIVTPLSGGRTTAPVLAFGWFLIEDYERRGSHAALIRGQFIDAEQRRAPPGEWVGGVPWTPDASGPWGVKLLE